MGSKYDDFWIQHLKSICNLIEEAYANGVSRELDVSGIEKYGERKTWYGVVIVQGKNMDKGEMAHARSLGRIVISKGLNKKYENTPFKLKISNNLKLTVYKLETHEPTPIPLEPEVKQVDNLQKMYISIHKTISKLPLHYYPFSKAKIPENGVYFFYEEGETIKVNGETLRRIVRVGTHQSQGKMVDRLRSHYTGNKNSSVFRKHIGAAIMAKQYTDEQIIQKWLKQDTPTIQKIEKEVSRILRQKFSFRVLKVEDKEERLSLERKLIATLAQAPARPITEKWLGLHHPSPTIKAHGLWNEHHTNSQEHITPQDLARIEKLVENTLKHHTENKRSTTRRRTLILIPCSGRKTKGGFPQYDRSNCIVNYLSSEAREKLIKLRREAAKKLQEKPGPDLGFETANQTVHYLEAYKRYSGNLYCQISPKSWNKLHQTPELKLVIVSALYGLVNYNEPIRDYNRRMNKDKISGTLLKTWWKKHGLSDIIVDYVIQNKIETVHDFLSTHYREATQPYPSRLKKNGVQYIPHNFPGLGSGSDYHRGKCINELILRF